VVHKSGRYWISFDEGMGHRRRSAKQTASELKYPKENIITLLLSILLDSINPVFIF
jgi:hypothetical protein